MLTVALVFALACVAIEMLIVCNYEQAETFMIKHEKFGIFFSLLLSWILGEVFGAQGVTVLMSAIFSTVATTIIYKTHMLKYVKWYRANEEEVKMQVANYKAQVIKVIRNLWGTLKLFYRIITAPYRFGIWLKMRWNSATSGARSAYNKVVRRTT